MKLYIGNISYEATENDIREAFSKYTSINDCYYPLDKYTAKPRGFAFLTFMDEGEGQSAIKEMNDHDILGRQIVVSEAREKRERNNNNRRGGGYNRNSNSRGSYNDRRSNR